MSRVKKKNWEWCGYPKHFSDSVNCRFHMATRVGDWVVSTLGDYRPFAPGDPMSELSPGRVFETKVFYATSATCECCNWTTDMAKPRLGLSRSYNGAQAARNGHMSVCEYIAQHQRTEDE